MCTPFDPRIALVFGGMVAVLAAVWVNQARVGGAAGRGFALSGVTLISLVVALLLMAIMVITLRCYRTAEPLDVGGIALRAGAVQTGAPPPAGTREPRCESGGYCTRAGKFCGPGMQCVDTYEWEQPGVAVEVRVRVSLGRKTVGKSHSRIPPVGWIREHGGMNGM